MAKNTVEELGGNQTIVTLINKFADKLWFQIIIGFWLLIGPVLFLANPFLNNWLNQHTQKQEEIVRVENHKDAFENSKQAYAVAKKDLTDALPLIGCDYIFLIEYHNGNENVITGIQFCRFDMTLQVGSKDLSYIAMDKFRDDIVARYDLLLGEQLEDNKLLFYTSDEFEKADRYLAQQLSAIEAKSFAIMNLVDKNGKVFGSLLCVSSTEENKYMNKTEILLCARKIETVFNNVHK